MSAFSKVVSSSQKPRHRRRCGIRAFDDRKSVTKEHHDEIVLHHIIRALVCHSPLHDIMEFLYQMDNINYQDKHNSRTIMHHACVWDNYELCEYIMENFAVKLHLRDSEGLTCLETACLAGSIEIVEGMLNEFCFSDVLLTRALQHVTVSRADNAARIASELLFHGANVHSKDFPRQPLHNAAREGDTVMVDVLLCAGAEIDAQDTHGYTPLGHAVHCNQNDVAAMLVERGASFQLGSPVSVVHIAARAGNAEFIALAAAKSPALLDAKDTDGASPLHYAARAKSAIAVAVLLAFGAKQEPTLLNELPKNLTDCAQCKDMLDNTILHDHRRPSVPYTPTLPRNRSPRRSVCV